MLHQLANNEILSHFWAARKLAQTKRENSSQFAYLDLRALQRELLNGKTHVSQADAVLESVLYGTESDPHFSGWTNSRLLRFLEMSGYGAPIQSELKASVAVVTCPVRPWSSKDEAPYRKQRRAQLVWVFRKRVREKTTAAIARAKSVAREARLLSQGGLTVNLGAGGENYPGFLKVDWGGTQDIYDNVVLLSKFKNGSVVRAYSNHVLEHIPPSLIAKTLSRWFEVLAPGGVIAARMPDARRAVLCIDRPWEEASEEDLRKFGLPNYLAKESQLTGTLTEDNAIQSIYGWSDSTPHMWDLSNQHKSLWTPRLARERFERAGFELEYCANFGTLNTLVVAKKP